MTAILSLYEILELAPGAGPAEIDSAYRRLIKQYHPDHAGGDGVRAAEINRAYRLIKSSSFQLTLVESGDPDELDRQSVGSSRAVRLASAGVATLCLALLVWLVADQRARHLLDQQWQRLKGDFVLARAT